MKIPQTLNPDYSFERFVVGACNQFAHAAAGAVADQPAKNYNPLFIYGDDGLGKTHLLNAIGLRTISLFPDMNVLYISAETFMNELIKCIRDNNMPNFREKYRNIDCLLIDDIQFIAGGERTQEEFFHTFNILHDSGKQIVVASDKFPSDIPNLTARLQSRFEWGLIADIQPPEIETRIAIVEQKARDYNLTLPDNVTFYIASRPDTGIRALEGYLVRVSSYSSLTSREIDLELVKAILKKRIRQNKKENDTNTPKKRPGKAIKNFTRSIEFPPEYRQAGIAILSYFAEILEKRYPRIQSTVRIEQEGRTVRLSVETSSGNIEVVERTLEEYGLVVTGKRTPEDFFENPLHAMALRNKLEIANLELRHTRDLLATTTTMHEGRVKSLEKQVTELHNLILMSLSISGGLSQSIRGLQNSTSENPHLSRALEIIATAVDNGISPENQSMIEQQLKVIADHDRSLFSRVSEIARHAVGSAGGHVLYSWIIAIANSLPK
ncbi:MAG: chromosomal replication initiator protein DnaA [Syntrophales bacterium]|nr:chromosomal replication initiator protein DnaA [Syntrophales bacterium]